VVVGCYIVDYYQKKQNQFDYYKELEEKEGIDELVENYYY
jgi:hypothetical protein